MVFSAFIPGESVAAASKKVTVTSAASTGMGKVKVKWKKFKGSEFYTIMRKTKNSSWEEIGNVSSSYTSYTDTEAKPDTTYYYTVKAFLTKSEKYSAYDKKGVPIHTPTFQPKISSIKTSTFNSIKLSWKEVKGATGYRIWRKDTKGDWTLVGVTADLTFKDYATGSGIKYYYAIGAYKKTDDDLFYGKWSAKKGMTTKSNKVILGKIEKGTFTDVNITWNKISGVTGYAVYRKTADAEDWEEIGITKDTKYTDSSAIGGNTYWYTVKAFRNYNNEPIYGKYDNKGLSVTLKAYSVKLNEAFADKESKTVTLLWNTVTGATGYKIYRKVGEGDWEEVGDSARQMYVDTTCEEGVTYTYTIQAYCKKTDSSGKEVYGFGEYGTKTKQVTAFVEDEAEEETENGK